MIKNQLETKRNTDEAMMSPSLVVKRRRKNHAFPLFIADAVSSAIAMTAAYVWTQFYPLPDN